MFTNTRHSCAYPSIPTQGKAKSRWTKKEKKDKPSKRFVEDKKKEDKKKDNKIKGLKSIDDVNVDDCSKSPDASADRADSADSGEDTMPSLPGKTHHN